MDIEVREYADSTLRVQVVDGPDDGSMTIEQFVFHRPGDEHGMTVHAQTYVDALLEALGRHRTDRMRKDVRRAGGAMTVGDREPEPDLPDPGEDAEGDWGWRERWHRLLVWFGMRAED